MSLFLGDTNKGGILHVTSDYRSSAELAGDPIVSTVFHSSLPYLELVTHVDITINGTSAYDGYSIRDIGNSYTGLFTATIPDSLFQYFNNDYLVMIQCSTRNSGYVPFIVRREATTIYSDSYYNSYNTYSTGARTFTNSIEVPIGTTYYNNPYTNMQKIQTRNYPDSIFRHLILSFGEVGSSIFDNIYLQGTGGAVHMDIVNPVGKAYVFNLRASKLAIRNTYGLSVQLDNSNFILTGNGNQINLSTYSFVKNAVGTGDINFADIRGKTLIGGLNMFNINKVPATGWDIDFRTSNFSITKLSSIGNVSLINPDIMYLKLVNKIDLPINIAHSGDYPLTTILNYTGSYKFFIIFITLSATMNGITVQLPTHYHIGFLTNQGSNLFAGASVAVTNNQGGKTSRSSVFYVDNSSLAVNIQYKSYLSGNPYNINTNITGTTSLLIFN